MTILTLLQEVDKVKYCKADLHRGICLSTAYHYCYHMSVEIRY